MTCTPILSALARSERYAQWHGRRHKPAMLWARQLIRLVHRWLPTRSVVVVGDRGYAALDLLDAVRPIATVITRLRLDARLVAPAPPRLPRQNGRPRIVGKRLPTLDQVRAHPATTWTAVTLARWYGDRDRRIEYVSQTAVWYHSGFVPVPIRWVLIRDPLGKFATQALLHMGIVNSSVVSALLQAAARTRGNAQEMALRVALELGDPHTLCCLLQALHDQPEHMPTDSFATKTAALEATTSEVVRGLIVGRLGRLRDTCAFEPVSVLLWRKDGSVRREVVAALKQLDDARALPLLRTVLTDENFMIRWTAVDALAFLAQHYPLEAEELQVASWLRNCLSDTYGRREGLRPKHCSEDLFSKKSEG